MTPLRIALLSLCLLPGCARGPDPIAPATHPRHVVLVTIDGVMWQDVFGGRKDGQWAIAPTRMPITLSAIRDQGVALGGAPADDTTCGVVKTAGGANISLPGYQEILGVRETTCRTNKCVGTKIPTLLDDAASAGITPVASIGSWDVLTNAVTDHRHDVVLSLGTGTWTGPTPEQGSHLEALLKESEQTDTEPGDFGSYRPDSLTSAIALEYFSTAYPRLLHVGLGDTDEYGHKDDRPAYFRSLREADDFIGDIVDEANDRLIPITVVITADHGRAKNFRDHNARYPESRRSFLLAFGDGIAPKQETCLEHDVTLTDIGATVRALVGLPALEGPGVGHAIDEILSRAAPRGPSPRSPAVRRQRR